MVRRLLALWLTLLLTGCAAQSTPPELSFAPEEGERLVLYTSHKEEVYWPVVLEFEQRTGIWVDVVAGGTNELLERIREMGLDEKDYGFYLDLRRYGSARHAGFGLGFERCVMYLTGMSNIRDVVPFPRTVKNCEL